MAKKNTVDWAEAVRLWKAGFSCSSIAKQCACSRQSVHHGLLERGYLLRTPQGLRRVLKPVKPR